MTRLANEVEMLRTAVRSHLTHSVVRRPDQATDDDRFIALSLAIRERVSEVLLATEASGEKANAKRLGYLSMEFLMGRSLENNLLNLGLLDAAREALGEEDFERAVASESDAALGNGGLGRLAACFLDSLATLDLPGHGYGINYEFGMFRQELDGGEQRERPDDWLGARSPWLIERPGDAVVIPIYGRVDSGVDMNGEFNPMWLDWQVLVGVPHDMPVVGYGGRTVNVLRLYSARASRDLDMASFNGGDYVKAIEDKIASETVSKVLYPSDAVAAGRELRLVQEYFLVACALRDSMRRFDATGAAISELPNRLALQLNDTHPALSVAELMRILVDEKSVAWDEAWALTQRTLAYTNHTLLPEALETWPVDLVAKVLPRHLMIILEINRRFLDEVRSRFPGDEARVQRMSLIDESGSQRLRMANLSIVGSHSVNGVAALHSELVKTDLVPDFFAMWPERFNNKTNGVTPRRWIKQANPGLSALLDETIGEGWVTNLDRLRDLEKHAKSPSFQASFAATKQANKVRLARVIKDLVHVDVDPTSIFDVQVKRIHEYKRQLLNALHIVHRYLSIVEDGADFGPARTFVFAGKAAPGYFLAKRIIRLIHDIGAVVSSDPRSRDKMRVVYLPDYRVSLAERIMPAADVSEQISTAGKEASGTGNMKLGLNGALTIGTLDGANVEILEEVGDDHIFIFGLDIHGVRKLHAEGTYDPKAEYRRHGDIRRVIDALASGRFSRGDPSAHEAIIERLLGGDEYLHFADFHSYVAAHDRISEAYADRPRWLESSILNVARLGKFSSDRSISEYAKDIWNLEPVRA